VTEATRAPLRLTGAAAFATATATLGLERLVQGGPWITACLAVILVVAGVGHLARSGRLPRPAVVPAQLVGALLAITLLRVPGDAIALIIPGPGAFHALADQVSAGRVNIMNESPPAVDTPGITTILVLLCAAFAILIDAIAVTYRRAVLAGLPLLAVYLVPATRRPGGMTWLAFIIAAVGYLSLVSADGHDRLNRWGRALGSTRTSSDPYSPANNPHSALSRRITTTAVVAALVLPWFIPTLPGVFKDGGGGGGGGGTISISQGVDLRKSLTTTSATPLLRYTTTSGDPRGQYLGMSVDDTFDGNAWTPGSGASMVPFNSPIAVPGLSTTGIKQSTFDTHINVVNDFSFSTVPLPYAPKTVSGIANPSYDSNTLMVVAGDSGTRSRRGQSYGAESTTVAPTTAQLNAATQPAGSLLTRYTQLPDTFPADVRTLAEQITASATTPFAKGLALQNYFTSSKFTYSTSIPAGDGNSAIESFLKNKVGFCQQFAGTMAAMARALGIPAYVEVGFTPGTQQTDNSYLVTTHDAHSWPMLYFSGIGWVRFEPTPSIAGGRGEAPAYTRAVAPTGPQASANPSAGAASPHPSTSAACDPKLTQLTGESCDAQKSGHSTAAPRAFASWGPFGVFPRWFDRWFLTGSATEMASKLAALVLLLLATVPALGRLARRRKRRVLVKQTERYLARVATAGEKAAGTPPGRYRGEDGRPAGPMAAIALAAWAELRECADDLGYEWEDSDTPRQTAARLSSAARFGHDASAAMGRVTTLTEQARYAEAPRYDQPTLRALPRDLRTLRSALAESATRGDRIRAAILPASSLTRLREGRERMTASIYRGTRRPGADQDGDEE